MDQVVAADRERVTVTGNYPDREIGPREREPGCDRRRTPVDRVHAVGLHVVGEARGAADPGDEDDPLPRQPELRQELLHRREDRVVPAARTPAHFLVGREVLRGELTVAVAFAHNIASIASASSLARSGTPRTAL